LIEQRNPGGKKEKWLVGGRLGPRSKGNPQGLGRETPFREGKGWAKK